MTAIPGFTEHDLDDVAFLVDGQQTILADAAEMASGQASAIVPTTLHPPGTVLVLETGDGFFYLADDAANGDRSTPPSITSSGHVDGNGVIEINGPHGTISVTTTTGSGTEANNATDLNADSEFEDYYIATSGAGELTIAAKNNKESESFFIGTATRDAAGFAEGEANSVESTAADYRVTRWYTSLADATGTAVNALAACIYSGHFRESVLSNLTAEAKAVLLDRGARFS